MTTGDAAAAAGLSVVPPTKDYRLGYDDINKRGDELANHMTNGTHPFTKITGQIASTQISDPARRYVMPRWGIHVDAVPEDTAHHVRDDVRVIGVNVPVVDYHRLVTVEAYVDATLDDATAYQLRLLLADQGSTNDASTGDVIASQPLINPTAAAARAAIALPATMRILAGEAKVLRLWAQFNGDTGGITIHDPAGDTWRITWREYAGANEWS